MGLFDIFKKKKKEENNVDPLAAEKRLYSRFSKNGYNFERKVTPLVNAYKLETVYAYDKEQEALFIFTAPTLNGKYTSCGTKTQEIKVVSKDKNGEFSVAVFNDSTVFAYELMEKIKVMSADKVNAENKQTQIWDKEEIPLRTPKEGEGKNLGQSSSFDRFNKDHKFEMATKQLEYPPFQRRFAYWYDEKNDAVICCNGPCINGQMRDYTDYDVAITIVKKNEKGEYIEYGVCDNQTFETIRKTINKICTVEDELNAKRDELWAGQEDSSEDELE